MGKNEIIIENGIVAGNVYDKYQSGNPISRYLVSNFLSSVEDLFRSTNPSNVHEVGCGEANLSIRLSKAYPTIPFRGTDFSNQVIEVARENVKRSEVAVDLKALSIYELKPGEDSANLILCCEVLEHLERPEEALQVIAKLADPYLLVSVPREPIWRCLNMVRGKYLKDLGNTPGHIQHWSRHGFLDLLQKYVDIVEVRSPLPWTVALCRSRSS